MKRRPSKR